MNLTIDFLQHLARHYDHVALQDTDTEATYPELVVAVQALARALQDHNPEPGTRVALCMQPNLEYVVCLMAVLAAGKIPVPVNPNGQPADVMRLLYAIQPSSVIVDEAGHVAAPCDDDLKIHLKQLTGLVLSYRDGAPQRHEPPTLEQVLATCPNDEFSRNDP